MKKQKKQMLIMLIILAVLGLAFLGLKLYNEKQAQAEEEVEGDIIIDKPYSDLELLTYDYEGVTYSFEAVDGTWYVKDDHSQNVKQYRIKAMLTDMAPLVAVQTIGNVTDLSQYGLTEPQRTITFGDDIEQYTLYVGDANTVTDTYYVYLAGDTATVYVIDDTAIERFNYTYDDLVEAEEEESSESSAEASVSADGSAESESQTSAEGSSEATE